MIRLMMLVMLLATTLTAQASRTSWINDAQTGQLLLFEENRHEPQPAMLLSSDADIRISGPVAHITLRQRFAHQDRHFAEALYVFPLPENAAVHGMTLMAGDRIIRGQIQEREQARRTYEQARAQGQRAALTEQQRPNIFSTSVANLSFGEDIEVTLEFSQVIQREGQTFSLRLPMTMTPRYQPSMVRHGVLDLQPSQKGMAPSPGTFPVRIDENLSYTRGLPHESHRMRINAYIHAGVSVSRIESRSHAVRSTFDGYGHRITLDEEPLMDRDFQLVWEVTSGPESTASFFVETVGDDHYGLLMLMPPKVTGIQSTVRKEVLLIVDTSGSMQGTRMVQARESLLHALNRLGPQDRFNVLEFNHHYRALFQQPQEATQGNLETARHFVNGLRAGGGTEMVPVLTAALSMESRPEFLRQVIFITDGAVSNEHAVIQTVDNLLGQGRMFTVGIGAAPNSYLLSHLAQLGRGAFTYIDDSAQVQVEMAQLLDRLLQPMMRDIQVHLPQDIKAEQYPLAIPDLYAGQPVVVTMKLNRVPDYLVVQGSTPQHWGTRIEIDRNLRHPGVASLWARENIAGLMNRITLGENESLLRPAVVDIALKHRLVSRYTSFVAVDETPVRQPHWPLNTHEVQGRLPADMMPNAAGAAPQYAYPSTSLGLGFRWLASVLLLVLALVIWKLTGRQAHVRAQ